MKKAVFLFVFNLFRKRRRALLFMVLAAVFLLAVFLGVVFPNKFLLPGSEGGISFFRDQHELGVFFQRVSFVSQHQFPYRYSRIEYPILGVLYLALPAVIAKTMADYAVIFSFLNVLLAGGLVLITVRIARMLGRSDSNFWLFLLPSFLYFTINRFDIWPALLVQIAFYFLFKHKFNWSFIFLSLAFLAKGYAIIFFPIFFLYYLNKKITSPTKISLWKNKPFLLFILPIGLIIIFTLAFAGIEALFPYYFQSTRNFGYGSLWAVYLGQLLEFTPGWIMYYLMKAGSLVLSLLQIALPVVIYLGYSFFRKLFKSKKDIVNLAALALMLYVFFSVYYSPQWFVWLLPILVLLPLNKQDIALIIIYDIFNYLSFPFAWEYSGPGSVMFSIFVIVRVIVLVMLLKSVLSKKNYDFIALWPKAGS